jgi:hypothetical protein
MASIELLRKEEQGPPPPSSPPPQPGRDSGKGRERGGEKEQELRGMEHGGLVANHWRVVGPQDAGLARSRWMEAGPLDPVPAPT